MDELHDKINNICVKKIMSKEPKLNKKASKAVCSCIFNKNKDLSIAELESRIQKNKDIPSIECIKVLDEFTNKDKEEM